MKRIVISLCVVVLFVSGCTGYEFVKTGVTDSYTGGKTLISETLTGFGNLVKGEKGIAVKVELLSNKKESDNGKGNINE